MTKPLVNSWKIHQNIILYAFDYCLPRQTYALSEFIESVTANEHLITDFMINYMVKEIDRYTKETISNNYLDDCHTERLLFKKYLLKLKNE
jgi:hypothetical protein